VYDLNADAGELNSLELPQQTEACAVRLFSSTLARYERSR
jgi:hypothetical protein